MMDERMLDDPFDKLQFTLDAAAFDAFLSVLDDPPQPNAKLKALMASEPPWWG